MKKCLYLFFSIFILTARAMEQPKELTLFEACEVGDVARLRELIKAGVLVDHSEGNIYWGGGEFSQAKPLMAAAHQGHLEIVLELLNAGADLNLRCLGNKKGLSFDAFCFAIVAKKFDVAEALLQAGADIDSSVDPDTYSHFWAKFFNKPITLMQALSLCSATYAREVAFLVASGAQYSDIFEHLARCNAQGSLKTIICNSFFVPSHANAPSSAHKIKTILLCLKRFAVPRDVRNLIICEAVPYQLRSILAQRISQKKTIPIFALDFMADACYKETAWILWPQLEEVLNKLPKILASKNEGRQGFLNADAAIAPFLDPVHFEELYGEQLRANIRARLANPYWFKRQLLGLEHTSVTKKK